VVESGVVALRSEERAGRPPFIASEVRAGGVLLPPGRGEELFALVDSSVTAIPEAIAVRLLGRPGVARTILRCLDANVRRSHQSIRMLVLRRHADRVRSKLLQLAQDHGRVGRDGVRLDFPLTHGLLSEMVGSTRETVTRAMDAFQREGFIEREGRSYRIHVPPEQLDRGVTTITDAPAELS
jgi:CRP-like cAMP-binding protein